MGRYYCVRVVLLVWICASLGTTSCRSAEVRQAAEPAQPLLQVEPELVSFPSGAFTLQGFLYRPAGPGPFACVLWNHGSEKLPGSRAELAAFYIANGYIFFVPHRHGHGRSRGEYIGDLQAAARAKATNDSAFQSEVIRLHETYLADTLAAVAWLKKQPGVNTNRLFMSGVSYGGIQTLLAAEADPGVKAFIPFAPGAMSWAAMPKLRERLLAAAKAARAPIFLLQAENDYNLGPSRLLGTELKHKGPPNKAKIYPPYGDSHQSGHGAFACRGTNVWGSDVIEFMKDL